MQKKEYKSITLFPGDMEGYVFAWDLANCLDPQCGSEKLCLRSVVGPQFLLADCWTWSVLQYNTEGRRDKSENIYKQ